MFISGIDLRILNEDFNKNIVDPPWLARLGSAKPRQSKARQVFTIVENKESENY